MSLHLRLAEQVGVALGPSLLEWRGYRGYIGVSEMTQALVIGVLDGLLVGLKRFRGLSRVVTWRTMRYWPACPGTTPCTRGEGARRAATSPAALP